MHIAIDVHNGIPIYEQIARHVKFAIANGALISGEQIPSVRELAAKIAVNPNTVSRAYRGLQTDGLIAPIRGTGLIVTPEALQRCQAERLEMIRERLRSVLTEAVQHDITAEELHQMVNSELTKLHDSPE